MSMLITCLNEFMKRVIIDWIRSLTFDLGFFLGTFYGPRTVVWIAELEVAASRRYGKTSLERDILRVDHETTLALPTVHHLYQELLPLGMPLMDGPHHPLMQLFYVVIRLIMQINIRPNCLGLGVLANQ